MKFLFMTPTRRFFYLLTVSVVGLIALNGLGITDFSREALTAGMAFAVIPCYLLRNGKALKRYAE